jgi:hypothetical protein
MGQPEKTLVREVLSLGPSTVVNPELEISGGKHIEKTFTTYITALILVLSLSGNSPGRFG